MITNAQLEALTGDVVSQDAQTIGGIGRVYVDETTGEPIWVTTRTGPLVSSETFVSLVDAELAGNDVRVAYARKTIVKAPSVDPRVFPSTPDLGRLNRHYGLPDDTPADAVTEAADRTRDTMTSTGFVTSADMRPTKDR